MITPVNKTSAFVQTSVFNLGWQSKFMNVDFWIQLVQSDDKWWFMKIIMFSYL